MRVQARLSLVISALALVVALSGVAGAVAGSTFIGSKQIRNGSVKSVDLRNAGVKSVDVANNSIDGADLENNGVGSPDIEPGAVEGEALDVPVLAVAMSGSVIGENGGSAGSCVFQLRVNDAAPTQGGGEVPARGFAPANPEALFTGVPAGPVTVSLWAKLTVETSMGNKCAIVGPDDGGVRQTVTAEEVVG
jgi:hypothetical protein